jgi:hypothetical protein
METRLGELNELCLKDLTATFEHLASELQLLKGNGSNRLDSLADELLSTMHDAARIYSMNIEMHADSIATSVILPRMLHLKQALTANAQKLRDQYKEEVEKATVHKLAELRPMFMGNREKMQNVVQEAEELKKSISREQKEHFEQKFASLSEFVDEKIKAVSSVGDSCLEELSKIESSASSLADASGIQKDPEISSARKRVILRLQEIGKQLQEKSQVSLNEQLARVEDKGKTLQEELIGSMEKDAFSMRKSTESSLAKIKKALAQADEQIQSLQNQYLQ